MADVLPSDELTDEPSDFGSLRPGTRLGRYELLVPIARGGMARVWAARQHGQRGFHKLVAIKTILPNLAEDPEFERMFLDEARIASGVHHPNVCEIYELGEERRTLYLAMEWVSGESLSRLLRASGKSEALDVRVVARIIADACAGVHAAHELTDEDGRQLDVVHRDLSPHNILLTADGVAKVCDFGVAKALDQLHEQTSAGQLKGKLSYMSPEQINGAPIDRRSDVFSLGCVLYEATTGLRPFRGDRDAMIMQAILSGQLEPPTKLVRSYPPELERIVLRALSQQPLLRFPSAERMRFALEEFLTKGQVVTQSNVAQVVRTRLGDLLERRKERIRQASSVAEQGAWEPANASTRDAVEHRSGVKQAGSAEDAAERPGLGGRGASRNSGPPPPTFSLETDDTIRGHGLPGSSTLPQAQAAPEPPKSNTTRTLPIGILSPVARGPVETGSGPTSAPVPSSSAHPPAVTHGPADAGAGAIEPQVGPAQYALAAFVGLLVAVLIAGATFYVWSMRAPQASASPPATATAEGSAPVVVPAVPSEIELRTTPSDAVLVVDGADLPRETRSIPRPAVGRTVTLVTHAEGYEDASFQVDYFTQTPFEVVLKPLPVVDAGESAPPAPAATVAAPPRAHATPKAHPGPPAVLPDNPY